MLYCNVSLYMYFVFYDIACLLSCSVITVVML